MTPDLQQKFKVNGSKVTKDISIKIGVSRMTGWRLGQNQPSTERDMWNMFKIIRSHKQKIEIWQISICKVKENIRKRCDRQINDILY